jgi:hypothetical protein
MDYGSLPNTRTDLFLLVYANTENEKGNKDNGQNCRKPSFLRDADMF